jgi:uncharacterized membrane protein
MGSILTDRHKLYACLSIAIGAVLGLLSSLSAIIILGFLVGGGLTLTGIWSLSKSLDEGEARRRTFLLVALCSILCAVFCFIFTVAGLYAHQQGWI